MFYSIRPSRFRYSGFVRRSVMGAHTTALGKAADFALFQISTNPRAQLYAYTDHMSNGLSLLAARA
jgi:hypothetical protein